MQKIDYSIIIPHYNMPDRLERLLLTIPVDKENIEVIVVDDRSDSELQKLKEIRDEWGKKGVNFYRNNNGIKGPGTCRNIGIKHSVGKWLLFADSDDYFSENMYEIIQNHRDSDADIIYFNPDSVYEETGERADRHIPYVNYVEAYLTEPSRKNELDLRYKAVSPCFKMIRRRVVVENQAYFGNTIVAQDVVFITKLCYAAKKIEAYRDVLYYIVKGKDGLTSSLDIERQDIRTDVILRRACFLRRVLSKEDYRRLNLNGTNRLIGMTAAGYPLGSIINTALKYTINGVKPVDFSMINFRTAVGTFINMRMGSKNIKKI